MGAIILPGNPPIEISLRRSARARRLSLRISQLDGRVTLTIPKRTSEAEGIAFATEKRDWIAKHLSKQPQHVKVTFGASIPVEGDVLNVRQITGKRFEFTQDALLVPGAIETAPRRIQTYLKELARDRLTEASDRYVRALGAQYQKLTLRDTRSRWGSCTSEGGLMYSWRLIMAPPEVLQYVAAHEVAHLRKMDHSPEFWQIVEDLYGDYNPPRKWLRKEGLLLHSYQF